VALSEACCAHVRGGAVLFLEAAMTTFRQTFFFGLL